MQNGIIVEDKNASFQYSRQNRMASNQFMMFRHKKTRPYKKPIFSVKKPEKTYISIEQALDYTGDNSSYSKRLLGLFSFYWIWYGFFVLGMTVFVNKNLVFFCPSSDQQIFFECSATEACRFELNQIMVQPKNALATDFQLYCQRFYLRNWIFSLVYMANIVSGVVFPFISDLKGRKLTMVVTGFSSSLSLFLAGFTNSFWIWMGLVFVASMCFGGMEFTGRVYLSEISGKNF